jgi:hypothetical protein
MDGFPVLAGAGAGDLFPLCPAQCGAAQPRRLIERNGFRLGRFAKPGRSSTVLRRFPADALKIDQSFIRESAGDRNSAAMSVRASCFPGPGSRGICRPAGMDAARFHAACHALTWLSKGQYYFSEVSVLFHAGIGQSRVLHAVR